MPHPVACRRSPPGPRLHNSGSSGGGSDGSAADGGGVLDGIARWLRHAALQHRVAGSLARWAAPGAGRSSTPVDTHEELAGCSHGGGSGCPAAALIIAVEGRVRAEGAAAVAAAAAAGLQASALVRGLGRPELDRLLSAL